jgi:hypothetical protein
VLHVPNRTVAHLNLADAYWVRGGNDREAARAQYREYREARSAEGKRVPERVIERLQP